MNELSVFDFEGNTIRTINVNGNPWWVAKDVCAVFGVSNHKRATSRLDDDEKGYTRGDTPSGIQNLSVVSEAGLYSLLFSMQPHQARGVAQDGITKRQEQLKRFKRWVTHEVLPSIRNHGV